MEVSEWVGTLRDVQSNDGRPLDTNNFRCRYIGLYGGIEIRQTKHHHQWVVFTGTDDDGWSFRLRTSVGTAELDSESKRLTLRTKNTVYLFDLDMTLDQYMFGPWA